MVSKLPYVKHQVVRQDRADGTIVLTSGLPLGPVAKNTGEWLHRWAGEAPDRPFLMERSGLGWRDISYRETLQQVQSVAASLLARGMGKETPIVALSGPGIDHGVLMLAAQYVGVPLAPLAEQYSLIPEARSRLIHCVNKIEPSMVFTASGTRFADALAMDIFDNVEKLVSNDVPIGGTSFAELLKGHAGIELSEAHAAVGPDTLAKVLFTSGSTGSPKGVPQSQRMLTVNQAQYLACLPLLGERPPVMVDWLPWNHVFAGNSNFNMILANGGTLILDDGKPVKGLFDRTLENLSMHTGTLGFNVPVTFSMLVEAFRNDKKLRERYFADLDMILYAGASLPSDLWKALEDMAREVTGSIPMMTSSWGLTETAPSSLIHHEGDSESGMVGIPVPQLDAKLLPIQDDRFEIRVKGPNVITSYFDEPEKDASSFDNEGYLITNDAIRFVDPGDMSKGVRFDGRITEDFKLLTGTWVQAATLRLKVLAALEVLVQDIVVTGADRSDLGLLIFPPAERVQSNVDAVTDPEYSQQISRVLQIFNENATGSSNRIARFLVMAQPPSVSNGEITPKGSLNISAILNCRAGLLERLYDDEDEATVKL